MGIFKDNYGFIRWGRVAALAVILAVPVGIKTCSALNNYEYSSGSRVGVINKMSNRGLFWKTDEGQMALEGIVSGGGNVGANVWDFSIDNQERHGEKREELAKTLNDALQSSQKVKIDYIQVAYSWPWRGKTNYFVQGVKPIEKR